jgi:DNA uptake protein ComE-like DNA-binding protein
VVMPLSRENGNSPDAWLTDGPESKAPERSQERKASGEAVDQEVSMGKADGMAAKSRDVQQWLVEPAAPRGKPASQPTSGSTEQLSDGGTPLIEARRALGEQRDENAELRARVDDLETENSDLRMSIEELETEFREQVKRRDIELAAEVKKHERQLKDRVSEVRAQYAERLEEQVNLERRFDDREAELRKRIDELESRLTEPKDARSPTRSTQPPATSTGRRQQTAESKTKAERVAPSDAPAAPTKSELLNLNDASFEELRKLGLSVTQSARLIAYRDVRGGYESLDELDEVPGLPKDVRRGLKARLAL